MIRNKVLFSPLGYHDPTSKDGHDGAMLHIVRHYAPSKVYLYFTKEMLVKKQECEAAIKNFNAEIIVKSNDTAIVENAADFDAYHDAFSSAIGLIREENPNADILINVTSGTSQMTLVLCAEVLANKEELFAIQVDNPTYNNEPNRCKEPGLLGLRKSVFKLQITDMLNKWDYTGAYSLLMSSKVRFSKRLEALLQHGYCRSIEQNEVALQIAKDSLKDISEYLYPCKDEHSSAALDFYNVLALKRERGEITDFTLRACAFAEYLLVNEEKMRTLFESIAKKNEKGRWMWDLEKAEQNHPELIKKLKKKGHDFKLGFNTFTLGKLARYCEIADYQQLFNDDIRDLRNKAAHGMSPITEDVLLEHFSNGSLEIQSLIETYITRIYNPPPESFEIFEYINNEIVSELD